MLQIRAFCMPCYSLYHNVNKDIRDIKSCHLNPQACQRMSYVYVSELVKLHDKFKCRKMYIIHIHGYRSVYLTAFTVLVNLYSHVGQFPT